MKTESTLISSVFEKMTETLVCSMLNFNRGLVIALAFIFSSSFLIAQTENSGHEATIIVKQQNYPGEGVMPPEVQAMVSEYNSSLSNGPLGETEPTGTPPTIENCPEDQTVECFGNVGHTASELEYTINCGANGIIIIYEPPGILETGSCPGTEYVVTYDVWDQCGNNVTCDQIFTIDNPGPEITSCPEGGIIESPDQAVSDVDALEFTFSCPDDPLCSDISISVDYSEMNEPCVGDMFIYTYTITDACGRSDECEQIFTIPPPELEIVCNDSEVVECLSDINPSEEDVEVIGLIEGVESELEVGEAVLISGDAGCSGAIYEVTYAISDDCDREASCTRTYTIENDGPAITAPEAVTIECASDAAPDIQGASFTTSCDYGGVVTAEGPNLIEGDGFCDGSIWEFVYTVTDDCGRTATDEQMVTISNEGPSITAPEAVIIECAADAAADIDGVVFTTSCDFEGTVTAAGPNLLEGDGFCDGSIWEFVYTVTDACGRTASASQMVTIENDGPTITAPEAVIIECAADAVADIEGATFTTSCELGGEVTAEGPNLIEGDGFCDGSIWEFVYTVTDDCGRTATDEQMVTISNDGASIDVPADVTLNCTESTMPENTGMATAIEACSGDLIVSYEDEILEEACPLVIERTWSAESECDGVLTGVQIITVVDEDAPVLNLPEVTEGEVSCSEVSLEDALAYINGELTEDESVAFINSVRAIFIAQGLIPTGATDECGDATFSEVEVNVTQGECPTLVIFECVFVAVDECGNTSEPASTFLSLVDNTAPVITCPEDISVSCEEGDSPDVTGMATATDDCSDAAVSYVDVVVSDGCPTIIERTFTATDDCGLTASCTQEITITYEDPTITAPEAVIIECAADAAADIDGVVFTTACDLEGTVTAAGPNLLEGDGFCDGSIWEFVYTVTDACGRTASASQMVTIENDGPTITAPEAVIIECAADAVADIEGATFTTSCELGGEVTAEGPNLIEGDGFCDGSIWEFVYTVTDDCGRTATDEQMVTISNDGASIDVPADVTLNCTESTMPENTGMATAIEACSGDLIVSYEDEILEEACPLVIERTWSAESECDGVLTGVQIITVVDEDAPVLNLPEVTEGEVSCSEVSLEDALAYINGELTEDESVAFINSVRAIFIAQGLIPTGATDECGDATFSEVEVNVTQGECPTLVIFECVFVAVDECGNTSEPASTFLSLVDNTAPVITCPEDISVSCEEGDSPDVTGMATATDDCSDAAVSYVDVVVSDGCPTIIERTFTATDDCGLTASCTQEITITYEDPTITAPEAVIIECAADAAADIDGVVFTTACDLEGTVTAAGPNLLEGDGFCDGSIWEFVYTVTDACGRTASASQMVTIENDGPTITAPEAVIIECAADAVADIEGATFTTSCELGGEVTAEGPNLIEGDGFCDGSIWEFVYTVTDDCGRTATDEQMVTISNDGASIDVPADVTLNCTESTMPENTGMATAIEACSGDLIVSYEDEILEEACPLVIERTWSAESECDGVLTGVQIITVVDEDAPVLNLPEVTEGEVSCSEVSLEDALAYINGELTEDESVAFINSVRAIFIAQGLIPTGATDECGDATFSEVEVNVTQGECPTLVIFECVFVAVDECGNTSEPASTFLSLVDNTAPVITCPEDISVSCEEGDSPDVTGMATATDDCSDAAVSYVDVVVSDGCPTIIERTFTATDDCGLTASCTQEITITYEDPTITAPEAVIIECAADAAADIDGVVFTTACDLEGTVTAAGPNLLEGDGFCDGSIWEFVYTVTDACGRTASASQMVTIENDGPTITAPDDIDVICIDDFVANADDAIVEASCELTTEVSVSEPVLIDGQGSCNLTQYEVTYTVTDQCDRTASDVQIVTCLNDGLEIIETPENLIVECYDDIVPDPWALEYFSPCSSDVFIQVTPPTQLCCTEDCPGAQYSVIYTITNDCGDEEVVEQIFTIDNEGPTIISCGEDEEVESVEDIVVSIDDVDYETACGTECEVAVVSEPEVVDNGCDGIDYIYTYTITDDCGRTATCERTFTILSDDPSCLDDNLCPDFTTFYVNHGSGIDGSDIYTVNFSGTEAILEFEVNVDFQVHMAFDAVNSLLYLVDANGGFVRIYDPATDAVLGDLLIDGDINQLYAVEYNPNDGLLYVGDANDDEIYTIDLSGATGVPVFFADAPVNGGDLALRDGDLYLADRTNAELYIVNEDADGIADGTDDVTFVGNILPEVNGMTQVNNVSDLIVANGNSSTFAKISSVDGSTLVTYSATLGGESFDLVNGDMASGCANNFGLAPCSYRLYYAHNPQGTSDYSLLQVELDPLGNATYTTLLEDIGSTHMGLSNDGSEIYMVGGSNVRTYDVESGTITNDVNIYNGANNSNLSGFPAAVVGPDNQLFIAGSGNNVWECDPVTGEATNIASGINVNGGDLIFAPTGEEGAEELWIITRNNATFTRVLDPGNGSFSVDVSEINGAAVLENGNVLLADGDGNSLLKEVDLSTLEVVATYDIDLPLFNGDLAGGCTEGEEEAPAIVADGSSTFPSVAYPNPASDYAVITFEPAESARTQVELFDMSGRPVQSLFNETVKSGLKYRVNVNTNAFENGIYIYRIINGSHQVTKKLMIVD